ncbi:hypothetical protein CRW69_25385 [Salmonella enterica subsp. enterica serovar Newport]|nr:hypothetical protein [Salmonella enterica]EDL3544169.1 hypothetical protein [Salmonella enterica subsp. enterica serovar Newport]
MTAWAAGLWHSIRKQNRSIIPVFNALSVPMKFKSPVPPEIGSERKKREGVCTYRTVCINCTVCIERIILYYLYCTVSNVLCIFHSQDTLPV